MNALHVRLSIAVGAVILLLIVVAVRARAREQPVDRAVMTGRCPMPMVELDRS